VKIWTVHTRPGEAPVLVREGFSIAALVFGPLWLWAQRAWIAGIIAACLFVLIGAVAPVAVAPILGLALAVLLGMTGRDLERWSLARRGFTLVHVLAARDGEHALARLLRRRPDLAAPFLPAAHAPRGT
jgi:hypothetical protein